MLMPTSSPLALLLALLLSLFGRTPVPQASPPPQVIEANVNIEGQTETVMETCFVSSSGRYEVYVDLSGYQCTPTSTVTTIDAIQSTESMPATLTITEIFGQSIESLQATRLAAADPGAVIESASAYLLLESDGIDTEYTWLACPDGTLLEIEMRVSIEAMEGHGARLSQMRETIKIL